VTRAGAAEGVTVSEAEALVPAAAVIVEVAAGVTVRVVTVKVASVVPGATVMLEGTVAMAPLLLDSVTSVPPAGAAALRVTVPVDELPPTTVEAERVSDVGVWAEARQSPPKYRSSPPTHLPLRARLDTQSSRFIWEHFVEKRGPAAGPKTLHETFRFPPDSLYLYCRDAETWGLVTG
jgi:hypothetical protein